MAVSISPNFFLPFHGQVAKVSISGMLVFKSKHPLASTSAVSCWPGTQQEVMLRSDSKQCHPMLYACSADTGGTLERRLFSRLGGCIELDRKKEK